MTGVSGGGGARDLPEGPAVADAPAIADAPEVSVIVCNYNGAAVLQRCIEHILAQGHPSFEIVVVDDGSEDESPAMAESFAARGQIRFLRSEINRGLSVARDLGARAARGRILAFVDNDGYPHPTWLEQGALPFADPEVGAVASLVFFNRNKCVVNGAGGTLNLRGYGGDFSFRRALEFAALPREALYPMGCGMLVRRSTWEAIAPLDPAIRNYYDDVEVGIRVWNLGQRVVVCAEACIDHDYGSSSGVVPEKALLCERNRIRTMLKYGPKRHLPRWLRGETHLRNYFGMAGFGRVPFRAWLWNLVHLPSALGIRRRIKVHPERYWGLVERSWRPFPDPLPEEHVCTADTDQVSSALCMADGAAPAYLVYGWFQPEFIDGCRARWSAPEASLLLRVGSSAQGLELVLRAASFGSRVQLLVRRFGEIEPLLVWPSLAVPPKWTRRQIAVDLGPGLYEVQVVAADPWRAVDGRLLGVAMAEASFVGDTP